MDSTYFFINSTFWNQKSFVCDQFHSICLVPTLTWIDIKRIKRRVSRLDNPRVFTKTFRRTIGGNEYLAVENRTGSETGNGGGGQVWGHVGLRSSQGKLCAGKPFWIYRTTQSMARYSRHAAIRHVPKYCGSQLSRTIPGILTFLPKLPPPPPPKKNFFLLKFWYTLRRIRNFAKLLRRNLFHIQRYRKYYLIRRWIKIIKIIGK